MLQARTNVDWINLRLFNTFGKYEKRTRLLPYLVGGSPLGLLSGAKLGLLMAAFPLAASTLITLLVLRQLTARRRR